MLLEDFWKIKIDTRFLDVYFYQGKKTKFKNHFEKKDFLNQLIVRLDSVFTEKKFCGNDMNLLDFYRKEACMPSENSNSKEWEKWLNFWGSDKFNHGYGLFTIDLISSSLLGGCQSWFNPKTGKIKGFKILEGIDTLENLKEEIEWFVSEFPNLDFYISFASHSLGSIPFSTLHLGNGKIELVDTITFVIDYPEGFYEKSKTIKRILFEMKFNFLWRLHKSELFKKLFGGTLYEHFINLYNYAIPLRGLYDESYFTIEEVRYLISWWTDFCIQYQKEDC